MTVQVEIDQKLRLLLLRRKFQQQEHLQCWKQNIQHLGENRPEGLLGKQETIQSGAIWHFIGNVQSRKVKEIINQIDYLHSVDRMSMAKEIHKRADQAVDCFVQVNVSGEVK